MNTTAASSRRRKSRQRSAETRILRLCPEDNRGTTTWLTADLIDCSAGGIGVSTIFPLAVGIPVAVNGRIYKDDKPRGASRKARVCWCLEKNDGSYRSGLALDEEEGESNWTWQAKVVQSNDEEQDHYELLQLSPTAHPDTIQRVYRILAQRYHPDNKETGDSEIFKKTNEAYQVLKDPEKRAAYDVRHATATNARWHLFESAADSRGIDGEKRKRNGILTLLYTRRMNEPDRPATSIRDLEDLLGCPRDHLQVSLWYLKEKGYIRKNDRGQYSITADGVDESERATVAEPKMMRQLADGKSAAI